MPKENINYSNTIIIKNGTNINNVQLIFLKIRNEPQKKVAIKNNLLNGSFGGLFE